MRCGSFHCCYNGGSWRKRKGRKPGDEEKE
jgi:hypothetical protein